MSRSLPHSSTKAPGHAACTTHAPAPDESHQTDNATPEPADNQEVKLDSPLKPLLWLLIPLVLALVYGFLG
jgi:hypothetical protein